MMGRDNGLVGEPVPDVFCWTKFGAEAGENSHAIFERKELERRRNGGLFLWGIGNSIRPSLPYLFAATRQPEVLFSPMKTVAAKKDAQPSELVMWCNGVGYDGLPYRLPEASLVTSRQDRVSPSSRHFALVCYRESPLLDSASSIAEVPLEGIRNLKTGTQLGASQVTSIVRRLTDPTDGGTRYPVVTRARLVYPFLIRLTRGIEVPPTLRLDRAGASSAEKIVDELIRIRSRESECDRTRDEQLVLV